MLNGPRLREQCKDCGRLLGRDLSHSMATPDTPQLDMAAAQRALDAEEERGRRVWAEYHEQRERENEEWWRNYNAYLCTDEWWQRRSLVMDRANEICEGCRTSRATQVHHLTYKHVTNEFLWELAAICDQCHERVHHG